MPRNSRWLAALAIALLLGPQARADEPASAEDDPFLAAAATYDPGEDVTLTIIRDGKKMDVDVTLGARPES